MDGGCRTIIWISAKSRKTSGKQGKEDVPLDYGVIPFTDILNSIYAWRWHGIITIELEAVTANLHNIDLCVQYIENYARKKFLSVVSTQIPYTQPTGSQSDTLSVSQQKWIEHFRSKRTELEKAIETTFKIMVATDEDKMMASLLLWDDGSIEIHYRDYHPENTSLKARSAVRIYHTISRRREDHKKESNFRSNAPNHHFFPKDADIVTYSPHKVVLEQNRSAWHTTFYIYSPFLR